MKRARSSITGRFVDKLFARRHPDTTVEESAGHEVCGDYHNGLDLTCTLPKGHPGWHGLYGVAGPCWGEPVQRHELIRKALFDPSKYRHKLDTVWMDAPTPPADHRCEAWTIGITDSLSRIERCACGAIRIDSSNPASWMERNSKRRTDR